MYDYYQCHARDVLCIDLKSFFASVSCIEKGLNPLTTKLAVVGDTKRQGAVVLAATPPLKALGIKTGSRLFEIPHRSDIYIINPSMLKYIQVSSRISAIALQYVAPEDFHQYSIDEFFMDITDSYHLFAQSPYHMARILQQEIYTKTQIFSTIGIGSNPLLAKLAMDLEAKRTNDGVAEWRYHDVPRKLWDVEPLTEMWGINKRTEKKLNKKGIFRIGDLAHYPVEYLKRDFGILGVDLHLHANGIDESIIRQPHVIKGKSYGKSQILMRDYQFHELKTVISEQIDEVFYRVREKKLYPTTIAFTVGYADKGGIHKQFTKKDYFTSTMQIVSLIWRYLEEYAETDRLFRTVGVSFSNLRDSRLRQMSLFEAPEEVKREIIESYLDDLRRKYGKEIVMRASSLTESGTLRLRKGLIAGHKG